MAEPDSAHLVVQKLLAEVRLLKVENLKLRTQIDELAARVGKPDPRLDSQQSEIERLRRELTWAREQREVVSDGLRAAIDRLRAARPGSD